MSVCAEHGESKNVFNGYHCRECMKAYHRAYKKRNKEKVDAYAAAYYQKNKAEIVAHLALKRKYAKEEMQCE